jgi:Uma2 family endonuclease
VTATSKISDWISPDEYLEGERLSEIRHEYVDGCVYAMAGASDDHNRIAGNIFAELSNQLRGTGCEAFIHDMKVKVSPGSNIFYYPDIIVVCDPSDNAKYFRERPSVIFEVLSPETQRADRREKLLAYAEIPTLKSYVLLEQERIATTVLRRRSTGWETETIEGPNAVLTFPEINVQIDLGRIYERTAVAKESLS